MSEDLGQIGKFKVIGKLGQGSFGVVYKGQDPHLKREVAIKVCTVEDEGLRKRFTREAQISGNLQHKNIGTVFTAEEDEEGVPYLVQEFLSGEDLQEVVARRDPLTSEVKIGYLLQVARGLAYAHSQGVVHRDIKPANVRVLEDGTVKIMDFGIAKLASAETQLTQKGVTMGTASYLPPEQVRGGDVDHRADIFSYGVLAYELLTYERPFRGNTLSALVYQILYKVPLPMSAVWSECPEALSDLVARCLEKKPERRFATLEELIPELTRICEDIEAGKLPSLREVSTVQLTAEPSHPSREEPILSQSQISRTAIDLEGGLGDETVSRSTAQAPGGQPLTSAAPEEVPLTSTQPIPRDWADAKTELLPQAELPPLSPNLTPSADGTLASPQAAPQLAVPPKPAPGSASAGRPAPGSPAPGSPAAKVPLASAPTQVIRQPHLASRAEQISALIAQGDLETAKKRLEETMSESVRFPPVAPLPPASRAAAAPSSGEPPAAGAPVPPPPPPPLTATPSSDSFPQLTFVEQAATSPAADKPGRPSSSQDLLAEISAERHPELNTPPELDTPPSPPDLVHGTELRTPSYSPASRGPASRGPASRGPASRGPSRVKPWIEAFLALPGWQRWGSLAALALLGLVALLIALTGGEPALPPPEPEPRPAVPRTTAPVPVAQGVVTVAALPWGEISEITDSDGYVQELPADPFTPVRMELPPGGYTFRIRHPDITEVQTCEVEVSVGEVVACEVELARPTVTDYFKESGWWQ